MKIGKEFFLFFWYDRCALIRVIYDFNSYPGNGNYILLYAHLCHCHVVSRYNKIVLNILLYVTFI